uniref:DB domain-containing protein n=1 Tax=Elaeophora elaphi TaxID=1147741 RepID=A0A0R3RX75_9BILA
MFPLLAIMLSDFAYMHAFLENNKNNGALGQKFMLSLEPQSRIPSTPTFPAISISRQSKVQNHPSNFQNDFAFSIQQQQQNYQQMQRDENDIRHRDLPIMPIVHQNPIDERSPTIGVSKHAPFPSNNSSQLLHQSFSMNGNRTSRRSQILSRNHQHQSSSSKFQLNERLTKFGGRLNVGHRQQWLLNLANLKLALLQPEVSPVTTSNKQPQRLSEVAPVIHRRRLQISQLPSSAIAMPKPVQHLTSQRVPHTNTFNRAFVEPVLTAQTTTLQAYTSPQRQDQPSARAVKNIENANDAFLQCCKGKKVDPKCESRCNFDNLDRRVLTAMFVGSDLCPRSNGRMLLSCAAQDSDHTNCCRANGVQQTAAGDKCLGFCQMTPESNFQADVSMLPCWNVLKEIKQCFRLGLIEKHNINKAA